MERPSFCEASSKGVVLIGFHSNQDRKHLKKFTAPHRAMVRDDFPDMDRFSSCHSRLPPVLMGSQHTYFPGSSFPRRLLGTLRSKSPIDPAPVANLITMASLPYPANNADVFSPSPSAIPRSSQFAPPMSPQARGLGRELRGF
jgi:hypothetical protein